MKTFWKKGLSSILAVLMLVSVLPFTLLASNEEQLPLAYVTQTTKTINTPVYDFVDEGISGYGSGAIGTTDLDVSYAFKAYSDSEMAEIAENGGNLTEDMEAALESNAYRDYNADFVVKFDNAIETESVGLSGYYSYAEEWGVEGWLGFMMPMALKANEEFRLLGSMGLKDTKGVTYRELCKYIREFDCGAFNLSKANVGTTMTVTLRLYETERAQNGGEGDLIETENTVDIASYTYKFNKAGHILSNGVKYYYVGQTAPTDTNSALIAGYYNPGSSYHGFSGAQLNSKHAYFTTENVVVDTDAEPEITKDEKITEDLAQDTVNDTMSNTAVSTFTDTGITDNIEKENRKVIEELKKATDTETAADITNDSDVSGYIKINLTAAEVVTITETTPSSTSDTTINEMKFDVKPYITTVVNNVEVTTILPNELITEPLKFRLPVNKNTDATDAAVYHKGNYLGRFPIDTDTETKTKYIELSGTEFSEYSYKLLSVAQKRTVEVYTRAVGGTVSVSNAAGGGTWYVGDTATVIAYPASGYKFIGWWIKDAVPEGESETPQAYIDNERLSQSQEYSFTVENGVTLVAVYESDSSDGFKLTINGSKYTLNGKEQTNRIDRSFATGQIMILEHTDATKKFMYWVNSSNNIMSTQPKFIFTLVSDTQLRSVYVEATQEYDSALVVFKNAYAQIIAAHTYSTEDNIQFPSLRPSKMGATFENWYIAKPNGTASDVVATEATIKAEMSEGNAVIVVPGYIEDNATYTVNVRYTDGNETIGTPIIPSYTIAVGNKRVITAPATLASDTMYFQYWTLNGVIVSYSRDYTMVSATPGTISLRAIYGNEIVEPEPTININQVFVKKTDDGYGISHTLQYNVPSKYEVITVGFVYGTKKSVFGNLSDADASAKIFLGNDNVFNHESGMTTNGGIYTMNITAPQPTNTVYAKAYVTYKDTNGNIITKYSAMKKGSYDLINTYSKEVAVTGNLTTEDVELSVIQNLTAALNANVTVPTGTKVLDDTDTLTLSVANSDIDDDAKASSVLFNAVAGNGTKAVAYDIHVTGVDGTNTQLIKVKMEKAVPTSLGTLEVYHGSVRMTQVASEAALTEADTFYYDAATGDVTVCVTHFSNYTFVYRTDEVTFYQDAADVNLYHIYNLKGLKEFRDSVNDTDTPNTYSGKTVVLDNDIVYDTEKDGEWASIGTFEGYFNLNQKTITGITGLFNNITSGRYSFKPDIANIAENYEAIKNGDGTYTVSAKAQVKVDDNTETKTTVTTEEQTSKVDNSVLETLKTTIESLTDEVIEKIANTENTNVTGVQLTKEEIKNEQQETVSANGAQAVLDAAKEEATATSASSDASQEEKDAAAAFTAALADTTADTKEISIKVDVEVVPVEYEAPAPTSEVKTGTVSFELNPVATVTVKNTKNQTVTEATQQVPVTNDMIDQKQNIVVSIYTGFEPASIVHADDNGVVINTFTGSDISYDAETGIATVTIHHFSSLTAYEAAPYTVTWKNHDGTVLATKAYKKGATPEYTGATPTKADDAEYKYTFIGWEPIIIPIFEDVIYVAQFDKEIRYIAKIGSELYYTLSDAFTAAKSGETVEIWKAGEYTIPNGLNGITVDAKVEDVKVNFTGSITGLSNLTFKGITFECGQNNYHGFQHAGVVVCENCTFNGKFFSYGTETYTKCTFNQTVYDYCMWVYGQDVTYDTCTFNTQGKVLNVYTENTPSTYNLTVKDCTFVNNNTEAKKPAVLIKSLCGTTELAYNVVISGTNKLEGLWPNENSPYTDGVIQNNGLWDVEENGTKIKVTVDSEVVYAYYAISWDTDGDGTVDETTKVRLGEIPTHADGAKEDTKYNYTFDGWDKEIVAVTGDATYTATFTATPKATISLVFPNTDTYMYRVGNANTVSLDKLFTADGGDIDAVEIETVNGASGTYDSTANTIQFSGTGVVKVTAKITSLNVSTTLTLEVVEAVNTTGLTSATDKNVVLLNDVTTDSRLFISNGYTFYGNGFKLNFQGNGGQAGKSVTHMSYGFIEINSGKLEGVQVICDLFKGSYGIVGGDYPDYQIGNYYPYYDSAVKLSGTATVSNCYIYGARNNILANSGNVLVKDTVLEKGATANIQLGGDEKQTITLENVTTIQYVDKNGVYGFGILDGQPEASSNTRIIINGTLTQYNWINSSNGISNSYIKAGTNSALANTQFITNGAVNSGIISLNNKGIQITDNRLNNDGYELGDIKISGYSGKVYSVGAGKGTVVYKDGTENYVPTTNGITEPTMKLKSDLGGQKIDFDAEAFECCYINNGSVNVLFPTGQTKELDLLSMMRLEKYSGQNLNPTVSCVDEDGNSLTVTNGKVTLQNSKKYYATYTVTDNAIYDKEGKLLKDAKTYIKTITISVDLKIVDISNFEYEFDKTKMHFYQIGYKQSLPMLAGLKIYDYDSFNNRYLRFDGDTDNTKSIAKYEIIENGGGDATTPWATVRFTLLDGGVLEMRFYVKANVGSGTYSISIHKGNDGYLYAYNNKTEKKYEDAFYWQIGYYKFTGNNGVEIIRTGSTNITTTKPQGVTWEDKRSETNKTELSDRNSIMIFDENGIQTGLCFVGENNIVYRMVNSSSSGGKIYYTCFVGKTVTNKNVNLSNFTPSISKTVKFDARGGICIQSIAYTSSNVTSVVLPTPRQNTKNFAGWYTEAEGGTRVGGAGESYTPSADITLYAHWTEPTTITFDANGGICEVEQIIKGNGNKVLLPEITTSEYKWFEGWYVDENRVGGVGDNYFVPSENVTITANWQDKYDVTFDSNGGNAVEGQTYAGTALKLPKPENDDPTKAFAGWYTEPNGGDLVGLAKANYIPTANITLYAKWNTIVTVTYNANEGTVSTESADYDGVTALTLPTPTRKGYWFTGWFDAAEGGNKVGGADASYEPSADITLYAQWSPEYTITFVPGDGASVSPTSMTYKGPALTIPTPTRTGYTFNGWFDAAEGGKKVYSAGVEITPTANVEVYAQWTINTYKVTLSLSNATGSITYNGTTVSNSGGAISNVPYGATVTVKCDSFTQTDSKTFKYNDGTDHTLNNNETGEVTFTMPAKDVTVTMSSSASYTPPCFAAGTLITMADGSQKPVEKLNADDKVLAFNHFTGEYEATDVFVIYKSEPQTMEECVLTFSDGTELKTIHYHTLFDYTVGKYVSIDNSTASEYIGHQFVKYDSETGKNVTVTLTSYEQKFEETVSYSVISYRNIDTIANGLLNVSDEIEGLYNLFEYDEDLKYLESDIEEKVEKYGMSDYSEWSDVFTYEQYLGFLLDYGKIAEGLGLRTNEQLKELFLNYEPYVIK